ncbi:MAG: methyltransferase [Prevotella sp.]|jgi:DNA modification methylase|nr:methyltransferase [Prevotella sp.]
MNFLHSEIGSAKDNFHSPVHNWYKFTAGFSYKFVESILDNETKSKDPIVFEPFAGCGTTLVSSQKKQVKAVGNESQEFMLDIIKAKLNWDIDEVECMKSMCQLDKYVKDRLISFDIEKSTHPLLQSLYSPETLKILYLIRNGLKDIESEKIKLFFKLGLSQIMHKSAIHPIAIPYISRTKKLANSGHPWEKFQATISQMLLDIRPLKDISCSSDIYLQDSRYINDQIESASCNVCITSPPYLNNLDYGEVSKVHTHFFDITNNWNDITTKVRRNLVTGATTHYKEAEFDLDIFKDSEFSQNNKSVIADLSEKFFQIKNIAKDRKGKKSFDILMMHYFEDMYNVLKEIKRVLQQNSKAYLILGDSAPYGVYVPTTEILGEISKSVGFDNFDIYKIRSRGTKWKSLKNRHSIELSENVLVLE